MNTRKIIEEVESILKANPDIKAVSTGKIIPLSQEENFPSVYINVPSEVFDQKTMTKGVCGYDRHTLINFVMNVDNGEDDLHYLDIQNSIEKSLLVDERFWASIIDRNIVGVQWDNNENYPKKVGELIFEVVYRIV